ncbi:hypothetical protein D3C80_1298410 [compost metagenome]
MTRLAPLARLERRPKPADWPEDEPMTLKEIIAVFYPDGPLTVATLRTAIANHRLTPSVVAGKHFITPAQLRALFKPHPCPDAPKARASTSAKGASTVAQASGSPTSTSSAMDRRNAALAAARRALQTQSASLPTTSPRSGPRKPPPTRASAQVIQLQSSSPR